MPTDRVSPILLAAKLHSSELVLSLLSHRIIPAPDLEETDDLGITALSYLLQPRHGRGRPAQAIEALLARGAKVDYLTPDPFLPGQWRGSEYAQPLSHIAALAISSGEDCGSPILSRLSPRRLLEISFEQPLLHRACEADALWAAKILLDAGVSPNREHHGQEGFPIAAAKSSEMLRMLSERGASLSLPDSTGRTSLELLSSRDVSKEILQEAAMISERSSLLAAGLGNRSISRSKLPAEVIRPLTDALFQAVGSRQKEKVRALWKTIGKKNALAARDRQGRSLLGAAIEARDFPFARSMIQAGQDVNEFDARGLNPLISFLTLSYSSVERDRRGRRRKDFWAKMRPLANFSARDPLGRGLGEILWPMGFSDANYPPVSPQDLKETLWGASFDIFEPAADGACFLQRGISLWLRKAHEFSYQTPALQFATYPDLLSSHLDSPKMTASLAADLLNRFFGEPASDFWDGPRSLSVRGGPQLERSFLRLLSRPDVVSLAGPISPRQRAAKSFPESYAILEAAALAHARPAAPSDRKSVSRSL